MIGSIADGVLLVDDAGIVQLWNPAAEAITGLPRSVVVGRPLDEAIPGWSAIADSLVVASDAAPSSGRATTCRRPRRREVWLSIQGRRLRRGNRVRIPRPDRGPPARAAEGGLHRHGVARASHAARGVHGAAQDAPARGRRRRATCSATARRHLGAVRAASDDGRRHPARERVDSPELEVATEQVDVRRSPRRSSRQPASHAARG